MYKRHGTAFRYDVRYYDIVLDQRIIYSCEFYADDARISVSVDTIEFVMNGDGTALTWTEQGALLDGFDGTRHQDCAAKAPPSCLTVCPVT